MIEALTIDAASTIRLLESIEALYPMLVLIPFFLDNARYHHAKLVREWPHAQECNAQQILSHMRTIRGRHARFLARQSPQELGTLSRFGHRQLPRHQPKGFSGSDVNGVYNGAWTHLSLNKDAPVPGLFRPSGAFSRHQFSAHYTISMFGCDFRQGQGLYRPRRIYINNIPAGVARPHLI
jgi:hypothetical protein